MQLTKLTKGALTDTRKAAMRLPLQTIGLLACDYGDINLPASVKQAYCLMMS